MKIWILPYGNVVYRHFCGCAMILEDRRHWCPLCGYYWPNTSPSYTVVYRGIYVNSNPRRVERTGGDDGANF